MSDKVEKDLNNMSIQEKKQKQEEFIESSNNKEYGDEEMSITDIPF